MKTFEEATKWVEAQKGMAMRDFLIGRLRSGATVASITRELGTDRSTLYHHLKKFHISIERTIVVEG